uniref:LisH domain-containing protein n=1 Tax=Romanomermis culicivorax TaxID=13658 RepID=A0A915IHS6_ROMCU
MSSCPGINPFCEDERRVNNNPVPHSQTPDQLCHRCSSSSNAGGKSAPPSENVHPFSLNLSTSPTPNESPPSSTDNKFSTYDSISRRLLEENFLLTALEFYAELMESGHECKRLRDFFSNPANFDFRVHLSNRFDASPNAGLARTSSAQTLDSLDYFHYSDDGKQNDEKLAVLEFELRKANETIKGLREQLTLATSSISENINFRSDCSKTDECDQKSYHLQSHEKKAINFLDFDHWDDIGLNIPRPNDLLSLFRQHTNDHLIDRNDKCLEDFACQTCIEEDPHDKTSLNNVKIQLTTRNQLLEREIERLNMEMDKLHQLVSNLDTEIKDRSSSFVKATLAMTLADGWKSERKVPGSFKRVLFQSVNGSFGSKNKLTELAAKESREKVKNNRVMGDPEAGNYPLCGPMDTAAIETLALTHDADEFNQKWLHKALIAVTAEDLINLLWKMLPSIISNIPTNKKEELIPLILSLASLHPDLKERDKMLDLFFRLFKKLDDEQRSTLVVGCVSYARHVGYVRTEAELLPQLWEQITDKSVERRLLIVEICGALVPHLPPGLISSLLLSILTQLLDDNSEQVKEATIKSLALVCAYIEDQDKFQSILNLMLKALSDTNESVRPADESTAKIFVNILKQFNYVLYVDVIKNAPFYSGATTDYSASNDYNYDLPLSKANFENPRHYFDSEKEYLHYKRLLDEYTDQEWYLTWSSLDFIYKELVPSIIKSLSRLECSSFRQLPHNYVTYFRNLTGLFGLTFTATKIKDAFLDLCPSLRLLSSGQNLQICDQLSDIAYGLLPVYVVGILADVLETKDKTNALKTFIKNSTLVVGEFEIDNSSLIMTYEMLSSSKSYHELNLSIIYELLTHENFNVRKLCAIILGKLCKKITDANIKSRALSALITLASDSAKIVKMTALPLFVEFIELETYSIEFDEKLRMQFSSYFDKSHSENDESTEITVQLLRLLAQAAPYIDAYFRDEYILPQLAIIVARNNLCQYPDLKNIMTASIFECYSALSCCSSLSPNSIRVNFLPGLKNLQKDLDNERSQVANSILKDLELKLVTGQQQAVTSVFYGKTGNSLSIANETVDVVKSRMFSKLKDFKEKMDMHKESVPKIFGVKK